MKPAAVVGAVIGVVFIVSAAGKAFEPTSGAAAFDVLGVPDRLRPLFVTSLVAVEALLGLCLLLGLGFGRARLAAVVAIALFTALLVYLGLHPDKPSCGCFGAFEPDVPPTTSAFISVGRNLCIMGFLLWFEDTDRHGGDRPGPARVGRYPAEG